MEKYYNDKGDVGVLVSYGLGVGWSTWEYDIPSRFMTMDKTLVQMALDEVSEDVVEEYIESVFGRSPCMGGWSGISVEWLKPNTNFKIEEYAGSESLTLLDDLSMTT